MSVTERYGADLFRTANACVMLDESNHFSPTYAPIMDRCLHSNCTHDDVALINSCLMGTSSGRDASTCFDRKVITFRNKAFHGISLLHCFSLSNRIQLNLHATFVYFMISLNAGQHNVDSAYDAYLVPSQWDPAVHRTGRGHLRPSRAPGLRGRGQLQYSI